MKQQVLLLEDVEGLGRSGDLASAKSGYIRNFLLPQKKVVMASAHTLRIQEHLKEERAKRAAVDRQDAEEMALKLKDEQLSVNVKVDSEGRLYGSVSAVDVVHLLQERGYQVERRQVVLVHPIRTLGTHTITFRLKEGVPATCMLAVVSEGFVPKEAPPTRVQAEGTV